MKSNILKVFYDWPFSFDPQGAIHQLWSTVIVRRVEALVLW